MSDLISRQAALDALGERPMPWTDDNDYVLGTRNQYDTDRLAIESVPTIDAVPVVHGHWKEDPSGYGFWICSACGFVSEASAANMLYKFCPNCGAKMDEKGGDQNG